MKQILMAFSGNDFSKGAFDFAKKLNEIVPVRLKGFFLPRSVTPVYEGVNAEIEEDKSGKISTENADRFAALCDRYKIAYSIKYGDHSLPMPQLIKETRYADIFIAGSEIFYKSFNNEDQFYYLNKTEHKSECPLILVPEEFDFPENIVFTYNGSKSSVYAIKHFGYLFPELCNNNIVVYESMKQDDDIPEIYQVKGLLECHHKIVCFLNLNSGSIQNFNSWLADKEKILVVAGAGERNTFSEFFKKSFASNIIRQHRFPVFIAHSI